MFFLILAAIVSADTVRINTVNTAKSIKLMMGGAEQTFDVDAYGRMYWAKNPSTSVITLIIGDDSHDLKTSATGSGYNGCNYNFDLYSDTEMYQNSGMECTKVFDKAPGAIELINDVGKSVYPAFNTGWGFSSDSVAGWLGADMIAVYTSENPYLAAINVKEGTELEVGYFDQSNYKSCGQATVGTEFIKKLSECTGVVGQSASAQSAATSSSSASEGKLHTLDQEYHMKETNVENLWEKDETWTKNELRKKGSEEEVAGVVTSPGARRCRVGYIWSKFRMRCVKRFGKSSETTVGAEGVDYSTVAEASQTSFSVDDWAIYGFAAIGIGALVQQAYKMVVKKNSETTPLYQEV